MHAIVPVFSDATQGKIVFGIAHSLLGLLLVHFGGFPLFEKVMSATIAMMFVTVLLTASLICEDWGVVVQGLFIPRIPHLASEGLGWTIALMGGVGGDAHRALLWLLDSRKRSRRHRTPENLPH